MTIEKLIEILNNFPLDWEVRMPDELPVTSVFADGDTRSAYLSDDMTEPKDEIQP